MNRTNGPTTLVLTRQKLAAQPRLADPVGETARGAYILVEPATAPKAIVIATGSEVQVAVKARRDAQRRRRADARGLDALVGTVRATRCRVARTGTAIVDYRARGNRGGVALRLAPMDWRPRHHDPALNHFGASAPAETLFQGIRPHRGSRGSRGSRPRLTGEIIMSNPLQQLTQLGQSPWYDFITRDLIRSGELARLIKEDSLRGMTSNPTIFEKAVGASGDYDADIQALAKAGKSVEEIVEAFMIADVRAAADVFRPVYDASGSRRRHRLD